MILKSYPKIYSKWHREFADKNLQRKLDNLGFKSNQCEYIIQKLKTRYRSSYNIVCMK